MLPQRRVIVVSRCGKGPNMTEKNKPLLIKRYASRRLYNTESSDYVTLEDVAGFIRSGRDVQLIDLKSGDDLTRQYLLQIISEYEGRGEHLLPVELLVDLVRAYASQATSVVPQFLAASFEMLRYGQSKAIENLNVANPMVTMPGFEIMKEQQEAFIKAMTGGLAGSPAPGTGPGKNDSADNLDDIKLQLTALQEKLSKM